MTITKYSKQVIENGIDRAVDNFVNREKRLADEYIALNPQCKVERNKEADLVIFGAEMARIEIRKAIKEWFSELEKVNA